MRNIALLLDLPKIRRRLAGQLAPGDTLVVNSASAMLLFCRRSVLKNHKIVLIQHNAPFIMYRRSFDFGGLFRRLKIALFRKYVNTFVMLSPFEAAEFRKYLPLDGKDCRVIRHAMPFPEKLPETFPRAAAILARLVRIKQVEKTIACAKLLPDVQFNIYGSGPDEPRLRTLASGVDNVRFRGYTDDIDKVFEENSMLLITSRFEGYSIAGIEACIRGRPVIVFNTYPAANDLVSNGESGIVLDTMTPEALADAVKTILSDPRKFRDGALKHRTIYQAEYARSQWEELFE